MLRRISLAAVGGAGRLLGWQNSNLKTKQEAEAVSRGQVALCRVVAVDKERSQ